MALRIARFGALLTCAVSLWANATVVRAPNVLALVHTSDLIVVGRFVDIAVTKNAEGKDIRRGSFAVERVLKHAGPPPSEVITISFEGNADNPPPVDAEAREIAFLRSGSGDSYMPADDLYPVLRTSTRMQVSQSITDPLGAVVSELVGVLSDEQTANDPEAEFYYSNVAFMLRRVPPEILRPRLNKVSKGNFPQASKTWANIALLINGDLDAINPLASILMDRKSSIGPFATDVAAGALYELREIDEAGLTRAAGSLLKLLDLPDSKVRRGAAAVFRRSGSQLAIVPLMKALRDSDQDVRYLAVSGLAQITGLRPVPSVQSFKQAEPQELDYWNRWSRSRNTSQAQ